MEINEIVKDIFGSDIFLDSHATSRKENSGSLSTAECMNLVNKYMECTLSNNVAEKDVEDDRLGRLGPSLVRFDITSRLGLFSISPDRLSINARSDFSTMRANTAVFKGKWMYEVQLGSKGLMQIGWSTAKCKFTYESGVGDTITSYAYDGHRVRKWNVATYKYGEPWLAGDIIGCTLDMDAGTIDFYRNGRHLGSAFDSIAMGPGFAYFPTITLALAEGLTANFGATPMHYPIEGYEPLQAPPNQEIVQAMLLFKWLLKIIEHIDKEKEMDKQTMSGEKISKMAFLMCLSSSVLRHIGPLLTIPYITEHALVPFMQELSDLETESAVIVTCLDLLWTFLEEHEIKTCLESIILFLLSVFRHVSYLLEYSNQCKKLVLLTKICQHVLTRQYLLQHLLFDQLRLPNFLNVKPPDKKGLADIVSNVWWETTPEDSTIEANKERYMDACEKIKASISELESLQVQLVVTLLDNSDGNEQRPTSRTIFLRKFKHFVPIANNNPAPITLCCIHRLLAAFKILWDAEVETSPVYVPCRVFYDGSIDYSRTERLGGVMSHLHKTYRDELIQLLGAEHEAITTMDQAPESSNLFTGMTLVRMININALGQGTSMILDTTPLPLNTLDATASLLDLLDSIILFYHIVAKKPLAKVALLRNSMFEYISAVQDMKTRIEVIEKKNDPESNSIKEELLRAIDVFNSKLTEQARHMAWIRAAVYSEEKQSQLAWLLKVVILTLKNASTEGNMFSFVPDFYLEALADLCVGLRNHMHPTARIENIPDYQEMFLSIAEFFCEHFMDPRIVNINSKNTLLLTLACFVFNPITLDALENVPEESRIKLITNLMKSYIQNRVWAESNWILARFWQGNGFAFRYERSPHLSKRIGLKPFQQESISQAKKPCPSVVYQGHVRDVLLKNPQDTTTFLNSLLNRLNWTFSEFIGMVQDIHNVSSRPERVFIESRQLKICATCFDLTISLLRVLEMIITVVPSIFNNPQSFSENLSFRLCQLICQILNRMSSQTSCFQHLVLLDIPDLEPVHHFPILAAVIGILLALLNEDMINFRSKSMTEVPNVTQILLMEPNFQMNTLYFTIGKSEVKGDINKQEKIIKQFSFLNYPNDVTDDEIKNVKDMIEYLEECRTIVPKSKVLGDNNDTCTICYAQPIAVTFKPCNHQTCRICIDRHLLNTRSCFFCKATIETVIDLSGNVLHDFSTDDSFPE